LQFLTQITELDPNPEKSTSGFADFVVGATVEKGEEIRAPYGVAARDGKVYVCDISIANIYIIDRANNKYTRMGKSGVFKKPVNITIAPDGTKYVCDTGLGKVVVFDAQDRFVRYLSDPSRGRPMDIALCKGELIVADIAKNEVEAWAMDGKFLRKIAAFGKGVDQVRMPTNVEVGPKGRIFVSETLNGVIKKFNNKGQYLGDVGAQGDRAGFFARPKGLAIAPDGVLYVADSQWEKIQVFGPEGRLLMAFGGARPGPSGMGMPAGIAIDLTGVPAFEKYIDKDFQAEYLLFVANQYGPNKIGVYAFGKSKTATYKSIKRTTATTPGKPKATTKPVGLPGGADK
jgi:DNA-binding beta-propeller fold protein YncE